MSLTQLTTYELPKYGKQLKRRFKHPVRDAKRAILRWHARQYFLGAAFSDVRTAAARNEDIFFASLMVAGMLAFSVSVLSARSLFALLNSSVAFSESSRVSFIALFLVMAIGITTISAWLSAFIMNSLSVSLMDGSVRKRNRSLRTTLRRGLAATSRVSLSWLLLATLAAVPVIALAGLSAAVLKLFSIHLSLATALSYFGVVAAIWVLYVLATYSLVGQVALFEPEKGLLAAFGRSRQLVARRGRLFVLATYLLLATLVALAWFINGLVNRLGLPTAAIQYVGTFAAMLLTASLKTALYRKRKLARSR